MNRIAPICLAMLSACSSGDHRLTQSSEGKPSAVGNTVVLDFQTGFKGTSVDLELDGHRVLSGVLITDQRVGLARSIEITARSARHITAVITLDHRTRYSYQIQLDQGHYIGFSKNLNTGKLQMQQRQHPFEYD
jgi:hypothetical protein